MLSRFWSWLTGRKPLTHVAIVLYTREGCHLCEVAHERLETARRVWGFRLTLLDVDSDPATASQYGESVPVVTVEGKVRFRGAVNEVLLTRLLQALSRGNKALEAGKSGTKANR